MVLTAYSALSSATNSSCHRHLRIKVCPSPVGPTRLRKLDISNGCQDHTVLPSASAPFVGTPAVRSRKSIGPRPATSYWRARRCRVHRIPHSTFVTTAKRPVGEAGRRDVAADLGYRTIAPTCDRITRRAIFACRGCANHHRANDERLLFRRRPKRRVNSQQGLCGTGPVQRKALLPRTLTRTARW